MEQWISTDTLLWISVGGLVIATIAIPWMMVKMPADAFAKAQRANWLDKKPAAVRVPLRVLKNVLAFGLIILGVLMFVTPGPGFFPIVLGILLADFPGKTKVQQWVLCRPTVMKSMNWFRHKFRRPPFRMPCAAGSH